MIAGMRFSILFFFFLTAVSLRAAENWPSFRGNTQGHAADVSVPLEWSAENHIRWKTPIAGKAWSSPIAVGDVCYITTATETTLPSPPTTPDAVGSQTGKPKEAPTPNSILSLRALALKLSDGSVLWDTEVFSRPIDRIHKKNSHASPTPVFEKGKLYVHFGHHGTACLSADTGKIDWLQESLSYSPVHGNGSSPIVVGEKLIFSADGSQNPSLIALNRADGTVSWKKQRTFTPRNNFSFATPLLIEVAGEAQLVSPCSGGVISYHPESGEEIWKCAYGDGYSVTPQAVFAHGLIYVSSGFDRAIAYAIRPEGKGDVTATHIAWKYDKTVPKESSFIVVGDEFYMNDDKGVLTCLDAKTGAFLYTERLRPEGGYSASPIYASGHIFFINGEGITTVIKPGKTFQKVSENSLGEYGLSSMAVISDGFLHRTEKHLFRIGK